MHLNLSEQASSRKRWYPKQRWCPAAAVSAPVAAAVGSGLHKQLFMGLSTPCCLPLHHVKCSSFNTCRTSPCQRPWYSSNRWSAGVRPLSAMSRSSCKNTSSPSPRRLRPPSAMSSMALARRDTRRQVRGRKGVARPVMGTWEERVLYVKVAKDLMGMRRRSMLVRQMQRVGTAERGICYAPGASGSLAPPASSH